ncbi:hypothetical protein F5Y05DRAFT_423457 [Hypoxylon sp. FL0543]|nr:hypothetical protein F5Y05DRAFT_423457 [Hypoxylon sp. FL0543]
MASSAIPRRPSPEERDLYYYGLAGTPKLIARTSCGAWVKPRHADEPERGQIRKQYATVGEHDIVSKWSTNLVERIVRSLKDIKWSFFVPIRLGLDSESSRNYSVVLIIAVEENTLSWERCIEVAARCLDILYANGIVGVEVEIREGRCHDLAASADLERLVDTTKGYRRGMNKCLLPLLSLPGYPIAYSGDRGGYGTLGLHVRLRGDASTYGLTCRHAVSGGRAPMDHYKSAEESAPQYHVQGNKDGFYKCLRQIEDLSKVAEEEIKCLEGKKERWNSFYHLDKSKQHLCPTKLELEDLERLKMELAYAEKLVEGLGKIEDKNSRRIGCLAFHPPMELSSQTKGYTRDWALIKLDESRFLQEPKNAIFIGQKEDQLNRGLPIGRRLVGDFLTLKTYITECDMHTPCVVGKMGATTGLTFGKRNEVEAVVRRPSDQLEDQYARQMVIVPLEDEKRFSDKGDSGSCVFNYKGEVIGLLTSSTCEKFWPEDGNRKQHPRQDIALDEATQANANQLSRLPTCGTNITFADPIQWVFDDIKEFTSRDVELWSAS